MHWRLRKLLNALRHGSYQLWQKNSYALNNLDLKLLPYLDFHKGFFVEAGANDGISQSNTLYFEEYMGWKGLLIEPIPALAELCRKNRPKCVVENCALVALDYPGKAIEMRYCNLMSVVKGGISNEEEQIRSGKLFLQEKENVYTISVPAKTLNEVLNQYGLEQIDLLSLDVEGYEAQVLKGINLSRYRPKFMLIEVHCRRDIDTLIGDNYVAVAVLNINEKYSDVLYQRK